MTHKRVEDVYEVLRSSSRSATIENGAFESLLDILRARQCAGKGLCIAMQSLELSLQIMNGELLILTAVK